MTKTKSKLYKCRVRLAGLTHHEVPKYGVTDKEVAVLRTIHGSDAVVGFKSDGETDRSDSQEYERLANTYGEQIVLRLFGNVLGDLTEIVVDDEEEVEVPTVGAQPLARGSKQPVLDITNPTVALD
jgi:hypothetical protein